MEHNFIKLGIAYLLGIISPGPSISLIIKNGIINSRMASIQTCIGIIAGIAVQAGIILIKYNVHRKRFYLF